MMRECSSTPKEREELSSPSYIAKIIQDRLDQLPLLDSVIQLDPIPSPLETSTNILYLVSLPATSHTSVRRLASHARPTVTVIFFRHLINSTGIRYPGRFTYLVYNVLLTLVVFILLHHKLLMVLRPVSNRFHTVLLYQWNF